jgi:hypothetical protein
VTPLPCPFCGSAAVNRSDGDAFPFYARCDTPRCPAFNTDQGFDTPEEALDGWNQRTQPSLPDTKMVTQIFGFTTKSMIRGGMVTLTLDDAGRLSSTEIRFSGLTPRLIEKPADS